MYMYQKFDIHTHYFVIFTLKLIFYVLTAYSIHSFTQAIWAGGEIGFLISVCYKTLSIKFIDKIIDKKIKWFNLLLQYFNSPEMYLKL